MNPVDRLVTRIEAELLAKADPQYGERIKGLVPTTGGIVGVSVPQIRELVKQVLTEHPDLTVDLASALLTTFGERRSREGMLFTIFVLARFRRQLTRQLWSQIDRWVELIDNWETCDQMATNLAAVIVLKDLSLVDDLVQWTAAPNPWRRRFAVAVTTGLNQHGHSFFEFLGRWKGRAKPRILREGAQKLPAEWRVALLG